MRVELEIDYARLNKICMESFAEVQQTTTKNAALFQLHVRTELRKYLQGYVNEFLDDIIQDFYDQYMDEGDEL